MTKSAEPDSQIRSMISSATRVDALLQLADHARGEALVDQPPVAGVQRRVHGHHHQPLLLELVLGRLPPEGALAVRGEALGVAVHRHAVLVPGDGPEARAVRLLVPVGRIVVPELGEPLVGHAGDEGAGIGQVDLGERHLDDYLQCIRHVSDFSESLSVLCQLV